MIWYGKEDMDKLENLPDFSHLTKQDSKVKALALDVAKKSALFRKAARDALNLKRKLAYEKRTKDIKTDPKVILFSTFDGRSYGDSPKAIYEYMLTDSRFDDYTFVWAFRSPKDFKFLLENKNTGEYVGHWEEHHQRANTIWRARRRNTGSITTVSPIIFTPGMIRSMSSFGTAPR
jgi:hypothetical protein